MLLISHRGNLDGPNVVKENHPDYLLKAQNEGFLVEVDIWYEDMQWFLGHDAPQYPVTTEIFETLFPENTIWHAKNSEALEKIIAYQDSVLHCFWHDTDHYTFTNYGLPWVYPGKRLFPGAVAVMPEKAYYNQLHFCGGICSDFIKKYADMFPF